MIYSRQREVILGALRRHPVHPTAEELYAIVRREDESISLATIYRNLKQLCENGLVLKIPNPAGADRYDGSLHSHNHAICKRCGAAFDINHPLPDVCKAANCQDDIEITDVTMLFGGICAKCAQNNK